MIETYRSRCTVLPGTSRTELYKLAWAIYHKEESKSKRTAYVRSGKKSYLAGKKVFLSLYFPHLKQKTPADQIRRLKFFRAGLDLVCHSNCEPAIRKNPHKEGEVLLRFTGETKDGHRFGVQLRRNARGNHFLMSTFPIK